MPARQSRKQRRVTSSSVRVLIAELLASRMLSLAGWHKLSIIDSRVDWEGDPRYWIPREILEARRIGDPSTAIYKIAYWIAYNLREGELDNAIRSGLVLSKPDHYGLTGLLRYIASFTRSKSLSSGLLLASLAAVEASRPCKRDALLEEEAESIEDKLVKFGSIVGLVLGLLFLVSMFLYDYLYIIAATVAMIAVIWYAIRAMSSKVLFLQVDVPWFECSISDELLQALTRPSRPSFPLIEILDQQRRV